VRRVQKIIDFRLRPPYKGYVDGVRFSQPDKLARRIRDCGFEPASSIMSRSIEDTISEMDEAGIDLGVAPVKRCSDGDVRNEDALALVSEYPNRFVAFISPEPGNLHDAADEVEELLANSSAKGVVLECGKWDTPLHLDDRRLYPIYDRCERLRVPVLLMGGGNAGPDFTYSSPIPIGRVARDFPDLKIVMAHGGWPWVGVTLQIALECENVYVSPDAYLFGFYGWQSYVDAANGYLRDRFLFATGFPYIPLGPGVDRFRAMFDAQVLPKLLYENAARVLGL